jgi:iron complex outermembrane receptor protein
MPDDCYPWIGRLNKGSEYAFFGDAKVATWSLGTVPNPDLKWETKTEVNVGVDFSFLNGRLSGAIDYYNRTTNDLLHYCSVDSKKYEAGTMLRNIGSLQNQGVEVAINGIPVKTKEFVWNLGLTLAHNSNKLLSLGDDEFQFTTSERKKGSISADGWTSSSTQLLEVDKPVGNFYGYKFYKIIDGEFYGYDRNNNIKPFSKLTSDKDKRVLGNALPILNWGISSSMAFYGVDFSFNLRGAFGGYLLNNKRIAYGSAKAIGSGNMVKCQDNGIIPPTKMTDYYLESGTYMKLGDITIGYTFNIKEDVAKYLSKARIYVTGQNLATATSYSGVDPEHVNMTGLEPGVEGLDYYPTSRTFLLGVNLAF